MEEWRLALPYRRPPISLNGREHWSVRHRIMEELKTTAGWVARAAKVPKLQACTIRLTWFPGNNRRCDPDNLALTLKGLVDGLVLAKILPDDNAERVLNVELCVRLRRQDPYDRPDARMELLIRDASALAPLG